MGILYGQLAHALTPYTVHVVSLSHPDLASVHEHVFRELKQPGRERQQRRLLNF